MAGNIIGPQNPTVGTTAYYEVSIFSTLGSFSTQYEWHLFKKQKNNIWKDITGTPKTGKRVPYTFGEIAAGVTFEIKVYEIPQSILSGVNPSKKLLGTLVLFPTSSKASKIEKVVLFNRGAKDSNKAGYRDTLIAQAHCIALFNQEIEFHLWEDDAPGKGHNAAINKNNRHTRVYKAVVNEKGIAEAKIPLSADERILRQMANQYLMQGDKNEGANHEYYVTASYAGKIQSANQVNVSVANPDYKSSPPASTPKKDSPKFPTGQGGKKQPDPKGNIVDAVFINDQGKELSKVTVGNRVRVRIHSKNLVGKHIQYVVWEYDTGSNDEIYRSESIKITADLYDSSGFIITKGIFDKGTDLPFGDPDADSQHYLIEIITLDIGAESVKFGVHSEGLMEVENVKSPAVVKGEKESNKEKGEICECEAKVRAFMRMLRVKEGTEKELGYTTQYSGKQFSNMSKHPEEVITAGKYSSSAAGAYQIMTETWKNLTGYHKRDDKKWHYSEKSDYAKKYNISSFDQESQDKFCLVIMKHNYLQDRSESFYNPTVWKNKEKKIHDTAKEEKLKDWRKRFRGQQGDIIQMIIDNDIKKAALISSLCWASLPDSPYGQQSSAYTFNMVKALYDQYLREELIETSKVLHLKKGFLKEFGYGCCGDKPEENTQENQCPEDCSQCFDYSDVIKNPKINDQSGNKNHNRYKNEPRTKSSGKKYYHTGTDILANVGTELHSMMCGEVVHVRTDLPQNDYIKGYESATSYGNTITIKSKDKNGKIVYHFYAHLSKVNVKVGEIIKHNKVIGLSGSTGNAMHVDVKYRHVHVEAGTSYSTTGGTNGKQRCKINADLNPENYMKSKFDNKGNTL